MLPAGISHEGDGHVGLSGRPALPAPERLLHGLAQSARPFHDSARVEGGIAVLIDLLNGRDRRELALLGLVNAQFSPAVRSDLAVEARSALLGSRSRVRVDMRGRPREETWDAVVRLRDGLPLDVRLVVDGGEARRRPTRITVDLVGDARAGAGA